MNRDGKTQQPAGAPERGDPFRTAKVLVGGERKPRTIPVTGSGKPEVPDALKESWRRSLELLVCTLGVSGGVVMRAFPDGVQVFLRAGEPGAAYGDGAVFPFGTGNYCESALGMDRFVFFDLSGAAGGPRCYAGMPLHWGDGAFFGTLCVLTGGDVPEPERVRPLMTEFSASMEKDLELLQIRRGTDDRNEKYARAMEAMLQYSPGGIFSYSAEADEEFSFISDNMLVFLGYTKEEFVRKFDNRFSRMVWREDRERVLREIDEQIRRGSFDNCEYRIEKKDGSLAWVHDEGHIVADHAGKKWFYVVIVDITENVRAQQRERDKFRAALQTLLAANPKAIGTVQFNLTRNLCGEHHGISSFARKVLDTETVSGFFANVAAGISEPKMQRAFLSVFDREALLSGFSEGKSSRSFDYLRADDKGAPIWVRLYLNLLKNPDTEDVEGVVYTVDVTNEKRRDEILRLITNQEYDLIALVHLDEGTVEAFFLGETLPKPFRELLPEPGAVYGLNAFRANVMEKWLHPEDREKYRQCSDPAFYRPLMDRDGHFEFVLRECFPEVMYRRFQHYYLGGDRNTVLVIESDVTEACLRQQREMEKLRAETERVKDIMDSIHIGICVLKMADPDHLTIDYVNLQMFRLLGFETGSNEVSRMTTASEQLVLEYTANAFVGVHPDDLERVKKTFRDHFESDYFVVENYRTMGSGGRYYWIREEVRLREVTPECRVFYATFHDVSEEMRLNGELTAQLEAEKQLRKEATAANAAKSEFLSRMSHDIRTPLNGIIGMTYLAMKQPNPAGTADCLAKIDTSSKFLLGLINDVLDMAWAESDRIRLRPEPYPIGEFNAYLDAVIRPLCREKGQNFVLDEQGALTGLVPLADKLRTNQVLFNLLSNAVKYTPEGGTITYSIRGREAGNGRIAIDHRISDTGVGMSEDFQKVLFEPFSQESRNDVSETRGSGLGLAIVKKLVDLMGGTVSVTSKVGKGTTFDLHLEFDAVPAAESGGTARPEPDAQETYGALKGKHALLCEDHPLNQEIVRELLEQKGVSVEIAVNGRQGVDLFAASPLFYYDVVLMDVRMPVLDGLEATRAIRALAREDAAKVPILAMTADAFADDVRKCIDAGMNAHLAKPIDPEAMYAAVAGLIR